MVSPDEIVGRIDALADRIRQYAREPEYSTECQSRNRTPNYDMSDSDVLRTMIELIAFSQGARADRIGAMIDRGVFENVFGSFEPTNVAQMDFDEIRKHHWEGKLSPMRFPQKIQKMLACASSLESLATQHGSFMQYIRSARIPERIQSALDIDAFWAVFHKIRMVVPPVFQNFISLCHLLQTFRFPCAKPDKVVMKVAADIGIVVVRKHYSEPDLRKVVEFMQSYAVSREISVPMVDFILLIHGAQTWAKRFVLPSYYTAGPN
jgi:hypothetical protein